MRRAGGFTGSDQLDLLLDNMNPELRIYVQPEDTDSLESLIERVNELELLNERRKTAAKNSSTAKAAVTTAAYDKAICCWRCKQSGNTRSECKKPAKKFCSQCGKDGVFTRDCHPWSENGDRTADAATLRSDN